MFKFCQNLPLHPTHGATGGTDRRLDTYGEAKAYLNKPGRAIRCVLRRFLLNANGRTHGDTDGRTDLRTYGRTDGPTDLRTDGTSYRDATAHLKKTESFQKDLELQIEELEKMMEKEEEGARVGG